MQQPGGDTLRRNFQQIQEGRTLSQNVEQQQAAAAAANRNQKQPQQPHRNEKVQQVEEPGPPSRPGLPHPRLIVVPDPPQKRPLPPTPRSAPAPSQPAPQQPAPQQPQRNSQNISKPMVSLRAHTFSLNIFKFVVEFKKKIFVCYNEAPLILLFLLLLLIFALKFFAQTPTKIYLKFSKLNN